MDICFVGYCKYIRTVLFVLIILKLYYLFVLKWRKTLLQAFHMYSN